MEGVDGGDKKEREREKSESFKEGCCLIALVGLTGLRVPRVFFS